MKESREHKLQGPVFESVLENGLRLARWGII